MEKIIENEKIKNDNPQTENPKTENPVKKVGYKKTLKKLLQFARPWYPLLIAVVVLALIGVALQLIVPNFVQDMVNYLLGGIMYLNDAPYSPDMPYWLPQPTPNFLEIITGLGILITIIYVVAFIIGYIQQFVMAGVTAKVQKSLRKKLSQKINKLPLSYLDKQPMGDVLSRITNDVDSVTMTLNFTVSSMVSAATMMIGATVAMFIMEWRMALVAVGSSIFAFMLIAVVMSRSMKFFTAQQKEVGDVNALVEEYFTGHLAMKTNNGRKKANKSFDKLNNSLFANNWKGQAFAGLGMPMVMFMSTFAQIAVLIVGAVLAFGYDPTISFGTIIAFQIYVALFTNPLTELTQGAFETQSTVAAADRIFELLNAEEMEDESDLNAVSRDVVGDVVFENVKFGYDKEKVIIHNFSADIKAGSKVAIVGPTGAGKTTLVNLLMKFYDIDGGDIKIDGKSISKIRRGNVSNKFSMVLQDAWIFNGTVRENLLYNLKIDKKDEKDLIVRATKACGVYHFIKTLPNGFDTVLDENTSISDGQKQLLTIARAMIKDAPLLILDEATSSVDTRTEFIVKEAMDKLTEGRTSFVIAHRLSTIKNADMILVLKDGDIIEKGTHEGLLEQQGFYHELYNAQFAS